MLTLHSDASVPLQLGGIPPVLAMLAAEQRQFSGVHSTDPRQRGDVGEVPAVQVVIGRQTTSESVPGSPVSHLQARAS